MEPVLVVWLCPPGYEHVTTVLPVVGPSSHAQLGYWYIPLRKAGVNSSMNMGVSSNGDWCLTRQCAVCWPGCTAVLRVCLEKGHCLCKNHVGLLKTYS